MSYNNILTNITSPDVSSTNNKVNGFFTNYFDRIVDISGPENDVIISHFELYTKGNKVAARALASAVIFTAQKLQAEPMAVLEDFKKVPINSLSSYLCMYLNLNRQGTSLLGVNNAKVRNKYVERSILP
jgi:hypothetical protein|tara:strand:- start:89 stop:475 length:387 start_codon:yes stop_codon:yes gene_type:complete